MTVTQDLDLKLPSLEKKTFPISRCFKGKILQSEESDERILAGEHAYRLLKATHRDFNQAVRYVVEAIETTRKANDNEPLVSLLNWMLENPANSAHNVLEPLTIKGLKTDRKSYPPEQISNLSSLADQGFLLIDIEKEYPWLKTALRRKIFQKAVEKIKAYQELMTLWREGKSKSKTKTAHLDDNIETTYKRLAKVIKEYRADISEKAEADDWLAKLLSGFDANSGKKGPVWLRGFIHQSFENPVYIGALLDEYGTDELGFRDWQLRKRQWEQEKDIPAFLKAFQEFFKPLRDNQLGLHGLIEQWGKAERLSPTLQSAFNKGGIEAVLSALGQKKFNYSQEGKGLRIRANYQRSQLGLFAIRAFGHYLATWRKPDTLFTDVILVQADQDAETMATTSIAEYWKKLEEQNPEIRDLLKILQIYQQKFERFKRPPAKRWPDPDKHPEWLDFQKDAGYRNLNFENRTVDLLVVVNSEEKGPQRYAWQTFRIGIDERFQKLVKAVTTTTGRVDKETGEIKIKEIDAYCWSDPKTREMAFIDIKGLKLLIRKNYAELVFRYEYSKELLSKVKLDGLTTIGTRVLSLDLGQKFLAALTAYERVNLDKQGVRPIQFRPHYLSYAKRHPNSKPVSAYILEVPGLSFKAIYQVERELSAKTGKQMKRQGTNNGASRKGRFIVRGTQNFAGLRAHLRRIKDERIKKAASTIVQTALKLKDSENRRVVIVHEELTSYKANLKRERFENNRLQRWSVQNLIAQIEAMAEPYGIMVVGISPAFTSQVCAQCNFWGFRFDIPSESDWVRWVKRHAKPELKAKGIDPEVSLTRNHPRKAQAALLAEKGLPRRAILVPGGDFFCCTNPDCDGLIVRNTDDSVKQDRRGKPEYRYTVNADVNAARNLNRKFHGGVNLMANKPTEEEKDRLRVKTQAFLDAYYTPRVLK